MKSRLLIAAGKKLLLIHKKLRAYSMIQVFLTKKYQREETVWAWPFLFIKRAGNTLPPLVLAISSLLTLPYLEMKPSGMT
jgi:hypothetical protein